MWRKVFTAELKNQRRFSDFSLESSAFEDHYQDYQEEAL